jgi:hypothetical protein
VAFGVSRYYVLLAFGASYSVGAQMASVSVVLPFLLAQKGILWAAGLLYPTFSIGFIAGMRCHHWSSSGPDAARTPSSRRQPRRSPL